jgi:tyramine---L-glutamate ligase
VPDHAFQSLQDEGAAMVAALAGDFAALPQVEVTILRDARSPFVPPPGVSVREVTSADGEMRTFSKATAKADWTVIIAPESNGCLFNRCELVAAKGGRLLGASGRGLEIACDKHATAEFLQAAGVATPRGWAIDDITSWPVDVHYPAVIKPRDGAGSQGVRRIEKPPDGMPPVVAQEPTIRGTSLSPCALPGKVGLAACAVGFRVEEYCPGEPASVAMLCGPAGQFALPPCRQDLSEDGRFVYRGGSLPLPPALASRATRLARRAVAALPPMLGYVGVDLVLGVDPRGAGDFVIEINPRLTTSYIGLRAVAQESLAAALLDVAAGRRPRLSFGTDRVEFSATGQVRVGELAPIVR